MSEIRTILERKHQELHAPPGSFERLLQRRDRRRRTQRFAAGSVGIAVFVAAVWVVTGAGSPDRTPATIAPGDAGSGPATVTGPVIGPTGDPFSVGFHGLPPEGVVPSEPPSGELVMSDSGIHPWFAVNLYADGRLIWVRGLRTSPGPTVSAWIEQRLTPEGIELLRSGAVELGGQFENPGERLPLSAWEDPELRPYVPSMYAVCAAALDTLPGPAAELLGSTEPISAHDTSQIFDRSECFDVTIDDTRALAGILGDAGFEDEVWQMGILYSDTNDVVVEFEPLLPDGSLFGGATAGVGG